jgi:hypothetical protein
LLLLKHREEVIMHSQYEEQPKKQEIEVVKILLIYKHKLTSNMDF